MNSEQEIDLFDFYQDLDTNDDIVFTVRTLLLTKMAKDILHRQLCHLEQNENFTASTSTYLRRLQRMMALLSNDLYYMKRYLKKEGVKVSDTPIEATRSYMNWSYWYKGRVAQTGGTPTQLNQQIKALIADYWKLEKEREQDGKRNGLSF